MARLYIKTPWSYETGSWFDATSVNFNSQKVHEDKIANNKICCNSYHRVPNIINDDIGPNHDIGTLKSIGNQITEKDLNCIPTAFIREIMRNSNRELPR